MTPRVEKLEPRYLRAAGDIDRSFGVDGLLVEPVTGFTAIEDAVLLADDKLLVGGGMSASDGSFGDPDYMLRRYNADGTLDLSFGGDGVVTGRFAGTASRAQEIHPVAGGKFVIGARSFGSDGFPQPYFIARFNGDGTLDTTFSGDGWVAHSANLGWTTTAVQADGAIVVATGGNLTRYTVAGAVDTSFGNNGTVTEALGEHGFAFNLKVLSDGTILAGGHADVNGDENNRVFALAKLNADGSPVTSFGEDGLVLTQVDPNGQPERFEIIRELLVLPDGKILAHGEGGDRDNGLSLALVRYTADGELDPTFGDDGIAYLRGRSNWTEAFLDDSGRVYFDDGAITRLTSDGAVDETFGRVFGGIDPRFNPDVDTYSNGIEVAGINGDGQLVIIAGRYVNSGGFEDREDAIVQIRRFTEDDGNPSAISLSDGVLTIAATAENDYVTGSDFDAVSASINSDGRMFDLADVDQIFCDAGAGDDRMRFDDILNTPLHLKGGDGRDRIVGGAKNDTLEGNAQSDRIDGGNGADRINGNGGNDRLQGEGGHDRIYGGAGSDGLSGSVDKDYLDGGSGPDIIFGGAENDVAKADDGDLELIDVETTV